MAKRAQQRGRARRSRTDIKKALFDAFRKAFPEDTVDISDGYQGNIHILVVSRSFDSLSEKQKQQRLWDVIDRTDLSDEEKQLISLVYPVSVAELK